jgi:hypothetical protein
MAQYEEDMNPRQQFLVEMYHEMWANINRHIGVSWQAVGVLAGAFAVFALIKDAALTADFASTLVLGASIWQLAHVQDSATWFHRNLLIIRNIERQFLTATDLTEIHKFFGPDDGHPKLVKHLRLQQLFGSVVALLVMLHHFVYRVMPELSLSNSLDPIRGLPYLLAVIGFIWLFWFGTKEQKKRQELARESPGRDI